MTSGEKETIDYIELIVAKSIKYHSNSIGYMAQNIIIGCCLISFSIIFAAIIIRM